ncbi:hypothetical protein GXW82_15460 [Streptacidiphilus sp. 4-A2]|nr:hypothetical protein [Streptacidiphilus sp. 4-A2]
MVTNQAASRTFDATSPNLLTAGSFEQSTAGWQKLIPAGGIVNWANYNTATGPGAGPRRHRVPGLQHQHRRRLRLPGRAGPHRCRRGV